MTGDQIIDIPAKAGRAVRLAAGDVLRVVGVEGRQVADLVALPAADLGERLSQGFTRMLNGTTAVGGPGAVLYSDLGTPLPEVVHDPLGVHDALPAVQRALLPAGPRAHRQDRRTAHRSSTSR